MTPALVPHLAVVDGTPTTTSRDVAEFFGKRHDDVLKAIRARVAESGEWGVRNIAETPYIDPQNGQQYVQYNLTKNGFTFVAQKFTGARAVQFQIAYIEAFDRMESALHSRPVIERTKPAYMREAWFVLLRQQASLMQHRALARAIGIHESTLSQVLRGVGKYGAGLASTARIAQKVLRIFCALVQPRQLVLL